MNGENPFSLSSNNNSASTSSSQRFSHFLPLNEGQFYNDASLTQQNNQVFAQSQPISLSVNSSSLSSTLVGQTGVVPFLTGPSTSLSQNIPAYIQSPSFTDNEFDNLRKFLMNAPHSFSPMETIKRFNLPNGDHISCICRNNHYFITGTDIVKILFFRFALVGRQIVNHKKFEEGIFSDLRNLKPGLGSVLEEPKSPFLEFLHRNGCIRTQKKQKVFFWNAVNHEQLFEDAMERSRKRDKVGNLSFSLGKTPGRTATSLQNSSLYSNCSLQQTNGNAYENMPLDIMPNYPAVDMVQIQPSLRYETTQQSYFSDPPSINHSQLQILPSNSHASQSDTTPMQTQGKPQPGFKDPLDDILRDGMDSIFSDIGTFGNDLFLNDPTQDSWQI